MLSQPGDDVAAAIASCYKSAELQQPKVLLPCHCRGGLQPNSAPVGVSEPRAAKLPLPNREQLLNTAQCSVTSSLPIPQPAPAPTCHLLFQS